MIQETEQIPFGRRFCLEIPEHESVRLLDVHVKLRLNISLSGLNGSRIPGLNEVDISATSTGRSWIAKVAAFPSRSYAIAVECGSAIGHGGAPFTYYYPMVDISSVGGSIGAHFLDVFLRCLLARVHTRSKRLLTSGDRPTSSSVKI